MATDVHKFDVLPVHRFVTGQTKIKRPKEIAYFSYDEDHQFRQDDSGIRYYYPPMIGANLSEGFSTFRQLDDSKDDHLDDLLATIADLEKRKGERCKVDLVTFRGMMTKILSAPGPDRFNSFHMNATLFQGTIFIEEDHQMKMAEREQDKKRQIKPGFNSDIFSYWGYKFESLSLIPDVWDAVSRDYIENRSKETVSNYAQYCSVVQTGIGPTSMIIGGEVDAVWDHKPKDPEEPINWVELKTSQEFESEGDAFKFEKKLCRIWAQSFLLGVPKIIVGFRSKKGILERVQEIQTKDIPRNVKDRFNSWNADLCINFTAKFLEFLKQTITSEGVWKIRRSANAPAIEVVKVEASGSGNILSPQFLEWRKELYAREVAEMLG